ncbi:MAG: hypothetical protein ACRC1R_04995 [Cetobacterium sp.]|uniref:hypothetical protein n=1 Tax=Cetobacterium sp. TaxID=2071632 RepID=UPI003F2A3517
MKLIVFLIISLYSYCENISIPIDVRCNILSLESSIVISLEENYHKITLFNPTDSTQVYLIMSDLEKKIFKINPNKKLSPLVLSTSRDNLKIYLLKNNQLKSIEIFKDFFS